MTKASSTDQLASLRLNCESFDESAAAELPEKISVLFVDDDAILRKLFRRSLKKVAPQWIVDEAASGETGLAKAEAMTYDLVFVDQYV